MSDKITTDATARWKAIRNTRWVSDDGQTVRSGAELARLLVKMGHTKDLPAAADWLSIFKRRESITTGVSGYTRTW